MIVLGDILDGDEKRHLRNEELMTSAATEKIGRPHEMTNQTAIKRSMKPSLEGNFRRPTNDNKKHSAKITPQPHRLHMLRVVHCNHSNVATTHGERFRPHTAMGRTSKQSIRR